MPNTIIVDANKSFKKGKCYYPREIELFNRPTDYFISEEELFAFSEEKLTQKYSFTLKQIKEAKDYSDMASDDYHIAIKSMVITTNIELLQ